jgi:hypothetical protein
MNEKIKQISEDYINGMIDIMMESLNRQIDAKFEEHFDGADAVADAAEKFTEDRIREIAEDEARDLINGASISA